MRRLAALVALTLLAPFLACRKPPAPRRLVFHYTAIVDGAVYESTEGHEPAELTVGDGALPAAAETALAGLSPGQETEVEIKDAYGPRDPKLLQSVPLTRFGGMASELKVGAKVLGARNGGSAAARVVGISGGVVGLDLNHPLAGKTVRFRLRLVSIR